jgi:hypothetical protein
MLNHVLFDRRGGNVPPERSMITERAEELYVARAAVEDAPAYDLEVTIAALVHFLTSPDARLTPEQWRACQENPRLRADYAALKQRLSVAELPQAVAASQGELEERHFPGGRLRLRPSVLPGQVYLIVSIESSASTPRMLLIEGKNGEIARVALPEPDPDGTMLVIEDTLKNEDDARAVRLLRDPSASGVLLP